jgi:hypothetical protein
VFLYFLPGKSGTRLADVLRYYCGDITVEGDNRSFYAN